MADPSTIHPSVHLAPEVVIEAGVRVGVPARGEPLGARPTVIGPGSWLRSGTVIYAGATLGIGVQTGHGVLIREDNIIGDHCSIGTHTILEPGNRIGDHCSIHSRCFLEHITLGRGVFVGPGVVFTDDPHPPCPRYTDCVLGATVDDQVSIGGNATILPGIHIATRALVAAGSVVTRDVPADTVVAGNPARPIRRTDELTCHTGHFQRPYVWHPPAQQ